jgi:hypothetical protein
MQQLVLDTEAGRVSEELARRGIPPAARVRVVVQAIDQEDLPMAALAEAGGAFAFLETEPELYSDADAIERPA